MNIKKVIKYTSISVFSLAFLFFATLIIHIAVMVKGKTPQASATTQLARVDFGAQVGAQDVAAIESDLKATPGIKSTYYNPQTRVLVYSFDNKQLNADQVFQSRISSKNIDAVKYTVAASDLMKGCPAMDHNSFYARLTRAVSAVVN
ncbi:hypothetical protein DBR32_03465 [Taibaiella sp. KBW10]|uniref:hypothetical protein n=1 Tax=Taibaiella sp. KBW10 TaxID=2153357 RepID=UPI000F592DA0|nr:hypothetical protein [Taibaiella sp. KBW10]RQO31876.1 hypothetical protein DBR32_03465 [Taibaiella sp. KBW10]